jgi:predicted thioesterase
VIFRVKAEDSGGVAGEGTHERVVIDLARFLQRANASG